MKHTLYPSVETMTQPETLSALVQQPITTTRLAPFQTAGWSSTESHFVAVETDLETDSAAHPRYVLKRMTRERDWVMQATDDKHGRATAIWQQGLLDRLPEEIDSAVIGCAVDGTDYAILMHDVTDTLLLDGAPLSAADNAFILDVMAALHGTFWEDAALQNPDMHLCSPQHLLTHTAPEKIQRLAATGSTPVLAILLEGWRALPTLVDADVAELLRALAHDPRPLCTALARYPQTLTHGDWRPANLGITRGAHPRLVLLDWARPTPTVPAVDLAYYLVTSSGELPVSREAAIDLYKRRLADRLGARFDASWWQPQLELSLLSAFLMLGCFKAWGVARADEQHRARQRAELEWWSERVRAGARWLA